MFNSYVILYPGQSFLDYYGGKTVKGTAGSSINFTWTILRPFTRVDWGLAASSSAFDTPPQLLMSFGHGNLLQVTPPATYSGRASGKVTGSQVSFSLKNLTESDGRLYGCRISDTTDADDIPSFDSVVLIVEGRYHYITMFLTSSKPMDNSLKQPTVDQTWKILRHI